MTNETTSWPTDSDPGPEEVGAELCSVPDGVLAVDSTDIAHNSLADTVAPEPVLDPDSWRNEVASRLERYRTRRKARTPRYPSLCLPFDAPDSWSRSARPSNLSETAYPASADSLAVNEFSVAESVAHEREMELSTNVIEFPRSAAIPVFHAGELAEPIFDHPRIVEAPEILPPPPALGGMLIEPVAKETRDRQMDLACNPASIGWRVIAGMVDGVVLGAALAGFTAIFLRFNPIGGLMPTIKWPIAISALVIAFAMLWVIYEYLFVVYTGSTFGRRACQLQLMTFSGALVTRSARKKRVMASYLSAFSAGLGYFWCVMDADGLCWHDRITRTYLVRILKKESEQPKSS